MTSYIPGRGGGRGLKARPRKTSGGGRAAFRCVVRLRQAVASLAGQSNPVSTPDLRRRRCGGLPTRLGIPRRPLPADAGRGRRGQMVHSDQVSVQFRLEHPLRCVRVPPRPKSKFLSVARGRWVPGLHGPGTLGKFLLVVGVCFVGAAISAIAAAGVTVSRRGALSRRFLVMGVAPIICMVLLIVVPPTVEWGMNMYHIWLPAP